MRIGGVTVEGVNECVMVLPRPGDDIIIKAKAVDNWDEFTKLCSEPKPNAILTRDGKKDDLNAKDYLDQLEVYAARKMGYLVVKSLEPSNIEWLTVEMDKPSTWINYESDFLASNLTQIEINMIADLVMEANQLDDEKLKEARDSFVHGQQQA